MDFERFDGLVRGFGQTRSRRQTLRGLAGVGAFLALLTATPVAADKPGKPNKPGNNKPGKGQPGNSPPGSGQNGQLGNSPPGNSPPERCGQCFPCSGDSRLCETMGEGFVCVVDDEDCSATGGFACVGPC